jgi:hypothetical protein
MVDLTKLSDDELRSIASGNLKDLPEETLRLISGATAPAGSAPPIGMAAAPAIEEKFDKDFEEKKAQIKRDQEAKAQEITTTSPFTLPGLLSSPPAAIVTGAGLLAAGYGVGRYGPEIAEKAKGAYKSIKERFISNPVETPVRIEPIGFESFADMTPVDQPSAQALENLKRADELAEANRRLGIGGNQPVDPGPIVRGQLPGNNPLFSSSPKAPNPAVPPQFSPAGIPAGDIPPAPPYQPSTPFSAAPPGAPAPESSAGPNSSTTSIVNNTVKEMIDEVDKPPQELRTGTGKPAFAGQGPEVTFTKKGNPRFKPEYGSLAEVPTGYAFVPGGQNMDTLRQILGQGPYTEEYKKRNFPQTNELAIQEATAINRTMNRPTRAEMIAAGMTPAPNTPGVTQYTSKGTKPTTIRGLGVGALVAIPDLLKAQTAGERAMAGANLLEAVLPPGFAMSGAGEGSTLSPQIAAQQKAYMDNLYRLGGGPLANTEAGERFRRNEEMTRRIAGRTGAAVPPQYRR